MFIFFISFRKLRHRISFESQPGAATRPFKGFIMSTQNIDWLGHDPQSLIPRLRTLLADVEAAAASATYYFPKESVALDDWVLMRRAVPCLAGRSTGHPDITDGAPTITSEVFFIDTERRLARSLSRWYLLEDPLSDDFSPSEVFPGGGN